MGEGFDYKMKYRCPLGSSLILLESIRSAICSGMKEGTIPINRTMPNGNEEIVYIGEKKAPLAFATFFALETRKSVWLDILYVDPTHRRKGLGRQIVKEVRSIALEHGITCIEFGTMADNAAMLSFARTEGFSVYGHIFVSEGGVNG